MSKIIKISENINNTMNKRNCKTFLKYEIKIGFY